MKKILFLYLITILNVCFAQQQESIHHFYFSKEYKTPNKLSSYNNYDFSQVFTSKSTVGIIGDDHQRIKIKLLTIKRSPQDLNTYNVIGKSSVKGNVCDFEGTMKITEIKEVIEFHYGVDNILEGKKIKNQGIVITEYSFNEDINQKYAGTFTGKSYSKWFLDSLNQMKYDNINYFSDSYQNNSFIGIWKKFNSDYSKKCNWGDYRVPLANQDFDIGAAEFCPNKKYNDKGWETYRKAWCLGDLQARKEETEEWWR